MFFHVGSPWVKYTSWVKRSAKQNKEEKQVLVNQGKSHGVLVYDNGEPVGWCQFGPREELPRIDRIRNYKPSSQEAFWRITCFFVDKDHRGRGVVKEVLRSALEAMRAHGVRLVEAYPIDTSKAYRKSSLYSGSLRLFEEFGFKKVSQLGENRVIVQKALWRGPSRRASYHIGSRRSKRLLSDLLESGERHQARETRRHL